MAKVPEPRIPSCKLYFKLSLDPDTMWKVLSDIRSGKMLYESSVQIRVGKAIKIESVSEDEAALWGDEEVTQDKRSDPDQPFVSVRVHTEVLEHQLMEIQEAFAAQRRFYGLFALSNNPTVQHFIATQQEAAKRICEQFMIPGASIGNGYQVSDADNPQWVQSLIRQTGETKLSIDEIAQGIMNIANPYASCVHIDPKWDDLADRLMECELSASFACCGDIVRMVVGDIDSFQPGIILDGPGVVGLRANYRSLRAVLTEVAQIAQFQLTITDDGTVNFVPGKA